VRGTLSARWKIKIYQIFPNILQLPLKLSKMLVKLAPGFNFTNVLRTAFTGTDPKSTKNTAKLSVFFALLGSSPVKAACKTLMKLTPVHRRCSPETF